MSTRAGRYEKQSGGYQAFLPELLPPKDLEVDEQLQDLHSKADQAIGRLDGAVAILPDADLFVAMYVRREAVLSSQIEGTHASMMDILEYEAAQEQAATSVDVREIWNYIKAMRHGLERLPALPLSRRLLCEVHKVLMDGVRGGEPHKTPGEVRKTQNWIGGASPATARFVPPPPDVVGPAFADLERYLHERPGTHLLKAGIAHAQFETIHPFLDGNGRTGRLLITFWLVEQGVLQRPLLYPSLFFKQHKDEYVDRLQAIRDEGAWEDWLKFFLDGMAQTAVEATDTAMHILQLRDEHRVLISSRLGRRAHNGLELLDLLLGQPTVTARIVQKRLKVSQPTASALVADLAECGILHEMTGRKKWRVFSYTKYLALFSGYQSRT
ncbi:MAG: Fic family protein [Actinomycetota bacterium]